ncbi:MAG: methylated-DNA--[protein]-cysteine S-methyltransferase [Spirochaetota bacterium]
MRSNLEFYTYLKYSIYETVTFFNYRIYIFGSEKTVKAIMFDSYCKKDVFESIINSAHRGLTPIIKEAIVFFKQYEKKVFLQPPLCDLSLYTGNEQNVLKELLLIQPGSTISYGKLAAQCGYKGGARFVGNVMAKNIFPVIYPCHRVIRSNGDIGNYSGGLRIKEFLLEWEKDN